MTRGAWFSRRESIAIVGGGSFVALILVAVLLFAQSPTEILYSESGFSLRYPRTWIIEKSKRGDRTTVREHGGHANLIIESAREARLEDKNSRRVFAQETERNFVLDRAYSTQIFAWAANQEAEENGYIAIGTTQHFATLYNFTELGFFEGPTITKVRGEVATEFSGEIGPTVDAMLLSLRKENGASRPSLPSITADDAKRRVRSLPGVSVYESVLAESHDSLRFEAEEVSDAWIVRAFASSGEETGEERGARMTAGRWRVDKTTGFVSKIAL